MQPRTVRNTAEVDALGFVCRLQSISMVWIHLFHLSVFGVVAGLAAWCAPCRSETQCGLIAENVFFLTKEDGCGAAGTDLLKSICLFSCLPPVLICTRGAIAIAMRC